MTDSFITEQLSKYVIGNDRNSIITHVSMVTPKCCCEISPHSVDAFFNAYSNIHYQAKLDNRRIVSGIGEMPKEYGMLCVDVDLKVKIEEMGVINPILKQIGIYSSDEELPDPNEEQKINFLHLYQYEEVVYLIKLYQGYLRNLAYHSDNSPLQETDLACVLQEKSPYISDGYYKSGFHLQFVNCFLSATSIEDVLTHLVLQQCDADSLWYRLGYNEASKYIDKTCRKAWLMYGSRKTAASDAYEAKLAFVNDNFVQASTFLNDYIIYDYQNLPVEKINPIEYYYPRIFSILPQGRKILFLNNERQVHEPISNGYNGYDDISDSEEAYEERKGDTEEYSTKLVSNLVNMLDEDRASHHDSRMEVGFIIYCVTNGSDEGRDIWNSFMRKSGKYDQKKHNNEWKKMYKGNYTIRSLKRLASIDNPEAFENICKENVDRHIKNVIYNSNHSDLAKVLGEVFSHVYVCACLKPLTWYRFDSHHWCLSELGIHLRMLISENLVHLFDRTLMSLTDNFRAIQGDPQKESQCKEEMKKIGTIIANLKKTAFKNSIMEEAREVFYDSTILEKLGKDPYIIGLKNGVADLKNFVIRPGCPEDYCSLQMDIEWKERYQGDVDVIQIHEYFEKVFPDEELREYFLDKAALYLIGGNFNKEVQFWTENSGNNGKSVTQKLFMQMFGKYAVDLPTPLITGAKIKAGAACPELARAGQGVRLAFAQEPSEDETLNLGTIKGLSGNDPQFIRGLYSPGEELLPMFKMIFVCNKLPKVGKDDPAFWHRVRIIPFKSRFAHDAPDSLEEQRRRRIFKDDPNFSDKIPSMKNALFWLLFNRLKKNTLSGKKIKEPLIVKEATSHYRSINDYMSQYIAENIEKSEYGSLNSMEIYSNFKTWYINSHPKTPLPSKPDFIEHLISRWGEPADKQANTWMGYQLRTSLGDMIQGKARYIDSKISNWQQPVGMPPNPSFALRTLGN